MVTPPTERPPMPKGTLLRFRRKGKLYSKPPNVVLSTCSKEESIMSLGEFTATGTKTFIKVMTRLGIAWARLGEVDVHADSSDFVPHVVLTLQEACVLVESVKTGTTLGGEWLDSAMRKVQHMKDLVADLKE